MNQIGDIFGTVKGCKPYRV